MENTSSIKRTVKTCCLERKAVLFVAESQYNIFRQYQLSPCHQQVGTTDCGVFAIAYSIDILFGNNPSEIVYDQSILPQHLVDCFEKGTLTMFPKYKCNVKYNDTTTSGSISSEDQHKWLMPRRTARLKK